MTWGDRNDVASDGSCTKVCGLLVQSNGNLAKMMMMIPDSNIEVVESQEPSKPSAMSRLALLSIKKYNTPYQHRTPNQISLKSFFVSTTTSARKTPNQQSLKSFFWLLLPVMMMTTSTAMILSLMILILKLLSLIITPCLWLFLGHLVTVNPRANLRTMMRMSTFYLLGNEQKANPNLWQGVKEEDVVS